MVHKMMYAICLNVYIEVQTASVREYTPKPDRCCPSPYVKVNIMQSLEIYMNTFCFSDNFHAGRFIFMYIHIALPQ